MSSESLKEIERELKRALKEKEKQLEAAQTGESYFAPTRPVHADGFTLWPVFEYLEELKRTSRSGLIAKFKAVFKQEPPRWPRWWLVEALGRQFQEDWYFDKKGALPETVRINNELFELTRLSEVTELPEPGEPSGVGAGYGGIKLVSVVENPFERGRAWTAFEIVELAGKKGVGFVELAYKLMVVLGEIKDHAERRATKMFTKWVERGWFDLVPE